ncbi:uncharacterized protein METZ01_LOCUS19290 [marine metagenome]|uniref:Uncharacterized protein n=1 Tax=marine metagenome TaxID=408172 RepID=A0A381PHG8_9ZZZZ
MLHWFMHIYTAVKAICPMPIIGTELRANQLLTAPWKKSGKNCQLLY